MGVQNGDLFPMKCYECLSGICLCILIFDVLLSFCAQPTKDQTLGAAILQDPNLQYQPTRIEPGRAARAATAAYADAEDIADVEGAGDESEYRISDAQRGYAGKCVEKFGDGMGKDWVFTPPTPGLKANSSIEACILQKVKLW